MTCCFRRDFLRPLPLPSLFRFHPAPLAWGLLILCLGAFPSEVLAQPVEQDSTLGKDSTVESSTAVEALPRPTISALRIPLEDAPTIDGELNEAVWQTAERGSNFIQREPDEGVAATQRSEFQVAYTQAALFLSFHAYDTDPSQIIAKEMGRDGALRNDDSIAFVIDTFLDKRNGYFLETNANGAKTDALITDEGANTNFEWDGIWQVKGRRTADGWIVEIEIPFSTLRFDPSKEEWGLQVVRSVRRRNETSYWAPLPRHMNAFRISQAGTVVGLAGIGPSRALDIKPFVVASSSNQADSSSDQDGDVGLDIKWGLTKALRLDATYNTDFAETEVDEQRINLTRFSLFFPEKREFFLENAGIFDFGTSGRGNLFKGFFSRRIGIDSSGAEAPVEWGTRLTGRAGEWNLGLLNVQVDSTDNDGATSFQVIRAKRNIGSRSSVGALLTRRAESGPEENQLAGIDFNLKPTDKIEFKGFFAASEDETADEKNNDHIANLSGKYESTEWEFEANLMEVGKDFQPGVGFLSRRDIRRYQSNVQYKPLVDKGAIRNLNFGVNSTYISNLDGELESRSIRYSFFGVRNYQGDGVFLSATDNSERLFGDFQISDGVVIPAGRYDSDLRWGAFATTSSSRPVSVRLFGGVGGFFDGNRDSISLTTTVRPNRFVRTETQIELNHVSLPAGSFDSNLYRQRVAFNLNPTMLFNALVQYNENNDALGLNLRFNWIYRPGADLFVVFNQTWDAPGLSDFAQQDRQVVVKFTYLFQL